MTTAAPARTMTPNSLLRGAASHAQHVFSAAKTTAPRPRARPASHALTRIPTIAPSLLTIDTVAAVSIFATRHSGHYAANRTRQTGIRGITRQHLVYQESAPTVLVGADFLLYRKNGQKGNLLWEKKKVGFASGIGFILAAAGQRRGPRQPLGLPVQDVAKRRRRLSCSSTSRAYCSSAL